MGASFLPDSFQEGLPFLLSLECRTDVASCEGGSDYRCRHAAPRSHFVGELLRPESVTCIKHYVEVKVEFLRPESPAGSGLFMVSFWLEAR